MQYLGASNLSSVFAHYCENMHQWFARPFVCCATHGSEYMYIIHLIATPELRLKYSCALKVDCAMHHLMLGMWYMF